MAMNIDLCMRGFRWVWGMSLSQWVSPYARGEWNK